MPDDPAAEASRPSVDAAFAHCESRARAHYENFPVASWLLPAALRPHVCAIYAFAREADDFADEPQYAGRRLERLDAWENRLDRTLAGDADHPVFVALGETIRRFDLPDRWLRDLLDAFRQDCRVERYDDWDELLDYCRRSANPVGRMVLHLFGYRDERRGEWSDSICTALQLTNFWQDVGRDWAKGRVYLPARDRLRHGVSEEDLAAQRCHDGFRSLIAELVERTRGSFQDGRPLLTRVRGRLALELRCVWHGGCRILDKIETAGCDVFRRRPEIGRVDVALAAGRALLGS
jgi:phytoene synthase